MQWPVEVALARPTPTLPSGPGWSYEIKVDGHRTVLWRAQDTVRLQSRSGRDVTSPWMDLARAGTALPPGVILDGEAVVIVDDAVSFEAAQARAASSPSRARRLAERYPALLIVWDVLALPTGDVRARPYTWRRAALLDLVANLPDPSPIQAVSATADLALAQSWYDSLQGAGAEGIVAKPTASPYRAGRSSGWQKTRHAETVDAEIVGYTGPSRRPQALVVRLPDGRTAVSQRLNARLAGQVAPLLAPAPAKERCRTASGDTYTPVSLRSMAEVLAGTTRHPVVTVTRLR
ncbi:ATP-dependent DNA ligase [Streptomyces sp. NBC_01601]|uniref:ATP-dependent DNA ligase n=1 Tax=Streptomyces sp. NBC_01601 TaxID=2975892 RepID=UPI002E2CB9B5|nr:DNA ligase [Streptomyces sp. NBC_01601]